MTPDQEARQSVFSPPSATDSVLFSAATDAAPPEHHYPAVVFPAYTDQRLREFLNHLSGLAGGNLEGTLPTLSEPGLYALAAALARAGADDTDATVAGNHRAVVPALLAELRRRNGRGVGADPSGPVRRGRLLQLVGAFTPLATPDVSSRPQPNLVGACPFCADAASFQVSLPAVTWQCLSCERGGALLEFAEYLLAAALTDPPASNPIRAAAPIHLQQPTHDSRPAAS